MSCPSSRTCLVGRQEVHIRISVENVVCAIAMVNIKVDDEDALQTMYILCISRGNCNVAEKTEAHGSLRNSMMPRWSNQSKPHWWL